MIDKNNKISVDSYQETMEEYKNKVKMLSLLENALRDSAGSLTNNFEDINQNTIINQARCEVIHVKNLFLKASSVIDNLIKSIELEYTLNNLELKKDDKIKYCKSLEGIINNLTQEFGKIKIEIKNRNKKLRFPISYFLENEHIKDIKEGDIKVFVENSKNPAMVSDFDLCVTIGGNTQRKSRRDLSQRFISYKQEGIYEKDIKSISEHEKRLNEELDKKKDLCKEIRKKYKEFSDADLLKKFLNEKEVQELSKYFDDLQMQGEKIEEVKKLKANAEEFEKLNKMEGKEEELEKLKKNILELVIVLEGKGEDYKKYLYSSLGLSEIVEQITQKQVELLRCALPDSIAHPILRSFYERINRGDRESLFLRFSDEHKLSMFMKVSHEEKIKLLNCLSLSGQLRMLTLFNDEIEQQKKNGHWSSQQEMSEILKQLSNFANGNIISL
ncbi:MAG: hypothetical protein LBC92_00150, partial [Rickettsiales bacterium]|nr:hypothetical protein [Rickettsiales bacterium]